MSAPSRLPSDTRGSRPARRRDPVESKEESSGDDISGTVPMRSLAIGGGSGARHGNPQGARIISGIRDRASGSEAAASDAPAQTPLQRDVDAVCEDRGKFDKLVAEPVEAAVALGGGCPDDTVQAMAARLQAFLDTLRGKLPEHRDELSRALTQLLSYKDTVTREASELARLNGTELPAAVRFGTEVTFSDPSLHALDVDPEERKKVNKAREQAEQAARGYLGEWAKAVERMFPTGRPKSFALDVRPASPQSIEGAMRFTFSDKVYDDMGNLVPLTWWYQTNIDNACLELQMAPTTLAEFAGGQISKWAGSIFEIAGRLGLQSGAAGKGGGHLSMDRASTFGDSTILFARLVHIYNDRAKKGGIHAAYTDPDAPFLPDMDKKGGGGKLAGEYDELMKRVNESMLDPAAAMSVDEVRDHLWNLLKKAKPLKEKLNNAGRYTALNIEPVTDEEDPGKQRVEFRRFQGQTSMDELCAQLAELLSLVEEARRA